MAERALPSVEETAVAASGANPPLSDDFLTRQRSAARRQLLIERDRGQSAFMSPTLSSGQQFGQTPAETTPNTPTLPPEVQNKIDYANALKEKVTTAVQGQREKLLSAPDNFDTQLAIKLGALRAGALGENVTPEELRWLSPSEQALIRSGKKDAIKAEMISIGTIMEQRRVQRADDEARVRQAQADTMTRFNTIASYNLFDRLSASERVSMETTLQLPTGSIDSIITQAQDDGEGQWEIRAGAGKGSFVAVRVNKNTGLLEVKGAYGTGIGSGGSGGSSNNNSNNSTDGETLSDSERQAQLIINGITNGANPLDVNDPEFFSVLQLEINDAFPTAGERAKIRAAANQLLFTQQDVLGERTDPDYIAEQFDLAEDYGDPTPLTASELIAAGFDQDLVRQELVRRKTALAPAKERPKPKPATKVEQPAPVQGPTAPTTPAPTPVTTDDFNTGIGNLNSTISDLFNRFLK